MIHSLSRKDKHVFSILRLFFIQYGDAPTIEEWKYLCKQHKNFSFTRVVSLKTMLRRLELNDLIKENKDRYRLTPLGKKTYFQYRLAKQTNKIKFNQLKYWIEKNNRFPTFEELYEVLNINWNCKNKSQSVISAIHIWGVLGLVIKNPTYRLTRLGQSTIYSKLDYTLTSKDVKILINKNEDGTTKYSVQ